MRRPARLRSGKVDRGFAARGAPRGGAGSRLRSGEVEYHEGERSLLPLARRPRRRRHELRCGRDRTLHGGSGRRDPVGPGSFQATFLSYARRERKTAPTLPMYVSCNVWARGETGPPATGTARPLAVAPRSPSCNSSFSARLAQHISPLRSAARPTCERATHTGQQHGLGFSHNQQVNMNEMASSHDTSNLSALRGARGRVEARCAGPRHHCTLPRTVSHTWHLASRVLTSLLGRKALHAAQRMATRQMTGMSHDVWLCARTGATPCGRYKETHLPSNGCELATSRLLRAGGLRVHVRQHEGRVVVAQRLKGAAPILARERGA